jgi:hypothetical protein
MSFATTYALGNLAQAHCNGRRTLDMPTLQSKLSALRGAGETRGSAIRPADHQQSRRLQGVGLGGLMKGII